MYWEKPSKLKYSQVKTAPTLITTLWERLKNYWAFKKSATLKMC